MSQSIVANVIDCHMVHIVIVLIDYHVILAINNVVGYHVLLDIDDEFVVNEVFSKSCLFEVNDT